MSGRLSFFCGLWRVLSPLGVGSQKTERRITFATNRHRIESCNCMHLSVQKALELMSLVPKRCNDMMNLGRLQGYEVYLCHGRRLRVQNNKQKD